MYIDAALQAITALADPARFVFLFAGIFVGLIVGILPGLGGVAGMSILLPFVFGMDVYSGIALLIGMVSVTSTSDTFPSVLLGVPGTASAQATIMDGYPLARQGRAGEALGAGFTSSLFGGLVGAVAVFAIIPIARPLVLAIASPQLFMLALLGLSMVGVLSTSKPLHGLFAGLIGLLLSSVGVAPAGEQRYLLFDWQYLWTGISLTIVALGIFALPEFIDLFAEDERIGEDRRQSNAGSISALVAGARSAVRHYWIVVVSAATSVLLGIIPGLGSAAVQWIIYGGARQVLNDTDDFGKGDIRGVIAPEASNNAVDAGALVPTIMFGIPGNGATAVLLGGFMLLGLQPGPIMLADQNLPIVLTIIWTLALSNVIATAACFFASGLMVKITQLESRTIVPLLSLLIVLAAFQTSNRWGDIVVLLLLGALGWIMKTLDWPRAPLLIGFVLGVPIERYLRISLDRYGTSWLSDPYVLAIGALVGLALLYAVVQQWRASPIARFVAVARSKRNSLDGRGSRDE